MTKKVAEKNHKLLIGIGNKFAGDDAFGSLLAEAFFQKSLPGVTVKILSGEAGELIEAWGGYQLVIVVDAVFSGAEIGHFFKLKAGKQKIKGAIFSCSTHAFGLAEAVEIAASLGLLPPKLLIFGIEGRDFQSGFPLSPELQEKIPLLTKEIIRTFQEEKIDA